MDSRTRMMEADVVVTGAGPAGIAAAIAAGRQGASVILIERYGFVGGMSTAAGVYPWMTFHTQRGERVIGGIAQEIVERLMERGGSPGHLRDTVGFVHTLTPYHPEIYKVLAVDMLREAGVKLVSHSFVDEVEREGEHIRSVTLTGKSGRIKVSGAMFVDASGDADVAYLAGAPTLQGREGDGLSQPMTMKFRMRGVDVEAIRKAMLADRENFYHKTPFAELEMGSIPLTGVSGFYKEWKAGGVPINRDQVLFFIGPEKDEVLINCTRVQGLSATDVEELTLAEEEGRKQVLMMAEFLQARVPGFAKASISSVAPQIGIRESRRIDGLYRLTMEDVVAGRHFEDGIAKSGYPVDLHDPSGKGVMAAAIENDASYSIPYRCLVARGPVNLLAAGRCISTTHEALATTRLTPSCMATGEAAGTAATLACKAGIAAAEVDTSQLREMLQAQGAIV
ncbi:FAD-dependent oxidoreductase [Paenibacillus macerans]|uniref:Pyridine nucleotide-disulfide oxidoreductase family protein n=1 Tax=Paenibacillus macerans TaxID=44252 RepID=A0A090Y6S3_PAEMA|nr:FAD-dependent oxidoreductase [Paenibacillus macerans]KFM93522.1 pyridine nucleotide-disulfide oxidoreductase family protein [Paenibacillus macerans]MCY7557022.1 FAD-dependent oxidoreductase [Paenibacillus macerans]MEC0154374.1 FAD-dependent oxidoreductase [Paenibacillus macerans]SUA86440.1 FAD dependent oxidoreductase [Paenibacillus macerans]